MELGALLMETQLEESGRLKCALRAALHRVPSVGTMRKSLPHLPPVLFLFKNHVVHLNLFYLLIGVKYQTQGLKCMLGQCFVTLNPAHESLKIIF